MGLQTKEADCKQLVVTPQYSVLVELVTELFSCVITAMYFADFCVKSFVSNKVLLILLLLLLEVFGVVFVIYFPLTFIELP
jgi:hypothetical protein